MARVVGWIERSFWGGAYREIKDLLKEGQHALEVWGNANDGWAVYLVSGQAGVSISPVFYRDQGDTMRQLKEAACRAYGVKIHSIKKGRNWL